MKKEFYFLLALIFLCKNVFSQNETDKLKPFLKWGYGYFNSEFITDGTSLNCEAGIKLPNKYTFSFSTKFGETINDRFKVFNPPLESASLIVTEKIFSLNMGYNFVFKNGRHSFFPQIGPFYSKERIHHISSFEKVNIEIRSFEDIGVVLELNYLYHLKSGISFGISTSGHYGYHYGPLFYTLSPLISIGI